MTIMRLSTLTLGFVLLGSACTRETDLPTDARAITVTPGRELVVTDDAVLARLGRDELAFSRLMRALPLARGGGGTEGATPRWLGAWSRRLTEEGHEDRAEVFDARVTCRWLHALPENACDATCTACAARWLPLEAAPLRLVAIANRTDLSLMPDRAADGGEGRLIFAITDGPGDDPRSVALPLTVIFEYAQRGSALTWTRRWHALGDASFVVGAIVLR